MYKAGQTIGSQDTKIECTGGNSLVVKNGKLAISAQNSNFASTGALTGTGSITQTISGTNKFTVDTCGNGFLLEFCVLGL